METRLSHQRVLVGADPQQRDGPGPESRLEDWHKTVRRGFTVQGMKSRHRKQAAQMGPGTRRWHGS
jgi:hypothetical protein